MVNVIPKQFYEDNELIKISYERDNVLTKNEMKEILEKILGDKFENIDYYKGQRTLTGCYKNEKNEKIFFMMANITFMGGIEGQHPLDLKRIQYNIMWRNFYNDYEEKGKVLWMGIYSYKDLNIFGVFEPETYLKEHEDDDMRTEKGRKSNYSCHIFLNDLLQGYKNGIFDKRDRNNNHIWTISSNYLKDYFEGNYEENPIIADIKKINAEIKWNQWIRADEAIIYMHGLESKTGFNKWAGNNWNGWYLEGLYSEYLYDYPSKYMEYIATSKIDGLGDKCKKYGLDLAFLNENYKFIGDLKNVCDDNADALLNDETKTKAGLNKYKRIWFVIYIHEKKPGKTNDYEMVKWYNHYKYDNGKWVEDEFNELSAPYTPHSINMKEMIVIELNEITEEKYFKIKKQYGKNTNRKSRKDKYAINKRLIRGIKNDDSFVIYREIHL